MPDYITMPFPSAFPGGNSCFVEPPSDTIHTNVFISEPDENIFHHWRFSIIYRDLARIGEIVIAVVVKAYRYTTLPSTILPLDILSRIFRVRTDIAPRTE